MLTRALTILFAGSHLFLLIGLGMEGASLFLRAPLANDRFMGLGFVAIMMVFGLIVLKLSHNAWREPGRLHTWLTTNKRLLVIVSIIWILMIIVSPWLYQKIVYGGLLLTEHLFTQAVNGYRLIGIDLSLAMRHAGEWGLAWIGQWELLYLILSVILPKQK